MGHFLVYTGRKWENVMGKSGITWELAGVFVADDIHHACLAGLQKTGHGTAVAFEGYAFGMDLLENESVSELGIKADPLERLERMGRQLEKGLTAIAAAATKQLPTGDADTDG